MAYEDRQKTIQKPNNLVLENRKRMNISGVEDVESFDDKEIIILTTNGNLIVRGSDLKIGKLSVESGDMTVEGLISELCYEEVAQTGSLWARLFH